MIYEIENLHLRRTLAVVFAAVAFPALLILALGCGVVAAATLFTEISGDIAEGLRDSWKRRPSEPTENLPENF